MANALVRVALWLAFLGVPLGAMAQEQGKGLICDRPDQLETFVSATDDALTAINEKEPNACGVVSLIYVRGETISQTRGERGTFDIVAIVVIAVQTPFGWQAIPPFPQFTIFKVNEEGA